MQCVPYDSEPCACHYRRSGQYDIYNYSIKCETRLFRVEYPQVNSALRRLIKRKNSRRSRRWL